MNLHRTSGKPDWEEIKLGKRTLFQRLAAVTHGVITPANAITLIGFVVLLYGLGAILERDYLLGLTLIVMGRLLDIADGLAAEATHTKSPLGELFDATIDKVGTVLTVVVLVVAQVAS